MNRIIFYISAVLQGRILTLNPQATQNKCKLTNQMNISLTVTSENVQYLCKLFLHLLCVHWFLKVGLLFTTSEHWIRDDSVLNMSLLPLKKYLNPWPKITKNTQFLPGSLHANLYRLALILYQGTRLNISLQQSTEFSDTA